MGIRTSMLAALTLGAGLVATAAASAQPPGDADLESERYRSARERMVAHIARMGVRDSATLHALRRVPRHEFVLPSDRSRAYGDHPLPIGYGQTISQPYIVGFMTEVLKPYPGMKVLEVGTGSGYQAAILAAIGCDVRTIEIFPALAESAAARLERLGFGGVTCREGDGHDGWITAAPFDAVIVTAAAGYIPPPLVQQLKPGGRMVIPVGSVHGVQNLVLVEKDPESKTRTRSLLPVRFVPLLRGDR